MKLKPIKQKRKWAVFSPNGYLQYRTISDTRKWAKERAIGCREIGEKTWNDYYKAGFTVNKVLVDIKILSKQSQ